jgi:hypothetical protein
MIMLSQAHCPRVKFCMGNPTNFQLTVPGSSAVFTPSSNRGDYLSIDPNSEPKYSAKLCWGKKALEVKTVFFVVAFYVAKNFTNFKIISFLNRYLIEKNLNEFTKNYSTFYPKICH